MKEQAPSGVSGQTILCPLGEYHTEVRSHPPLLCDRGKACTSEPALSLEVLIEAILEHSGNI